VPTLRISPIRFSIGAFDTLFRYLRRSTGASRTTLLAGPSVSVNLNSTYWIFSWRYSCGGYVVSGTAKNSRITVPLPSAPSNTPTSVAL